MVTGFDSDGITMINITNPASPAVLDTLDKDADGLALNGAYGIDYYWADGKHYVIVASVHDDGVQVIDVSNPANMVGKGNITDAAGLLLSDAQDVHAFQTGASGVHAIATAFNDNGVQVLDITDPDNITGTDNLQDTADSILEDSSFVDVFALSGGSRSVYAVVTSQDEDGVQILDVTDPADIVPVASLEDGGSSMRLNNPKNLELFTHDNDERAIFVAVASDDSNALQVISLADPYHPVGVGNYQDTGSTLLRDARAVAVYSYDGAMYAAVVASGSERGIQVLSLTPSTNTNTAPEVDAKHDRAVYEGTTIFIDALVEDADDDPVSYRWTASGGAFLDDTVETPYYTAPAVSSDTTHTLRLTATDHHGASTHDELVITVLNHDEGDGIKPRLVGSLPDGTHDLEITTHLGTFIATGIGETRTSPYAVVAARGDDALSTINLEDPANPAFVDSVTGLGGAFGVDTFLVAGKPWAVVTGADDGALSTIPLSAPSNLPTPNKLAHENATNDVAVFTRSGTLYAATNSYDNGGLQVFSLADPASPVSVGNVDTWSTTTFKVDTFEASGVPYVGVTSAEDCAVEFFSLANPASPSRASILGEHGCEYLGVSGLATFEHSGRPYGALAVALTSMFQVVDLSDPTAITVSGNFTDEKTLYGVSSIDIFTWDDTRWAAVTRASGDIAVFDVSNPARPAFAGNITTGAKPAVDFDGLDTIKVNGNIYAAAGSPFDGGVHVVQLTDNDVPVVNAGPDQSVTAGDAVTLAGSATDDDAALAYLWQHDSNLAITFDDTSPTPTFTIPINAENATIRFTLNVDDFHGAVGTDSMLLHVTAKPGPDVDAGPDQVVNEGDIVTLSGTASSPDGYNPLVPYWTYLAGAGDPPITTIADTGRLSTTFTAPLVRANTTYTFLLTVIDSQGGLGDDTVDILVVDVPSAAPIVSVGQNHVITEGETVTLTATATDPEGEDMTFLWTCRDVDKPNTFTLGTTLSVEFTGPDVGRNGATFICTFKATDPHGSVGSAELRVRVDNIPDDGPSLQMIGESDPTVVVGTSWVDPGATCTTIRDDTISVPVTTSGSVDTGTIGSYTVSYTCEYAGKSVTHERTVTVIAASSDQSPHIFVSYHRGAVKSGSPNADYSGDAVCRDREDGDISHRITSSTRYVPGDASNRPYAVITYSCTDSGGNTSRVSQEVGIISDNTPPTISTGGSMYMNVGDTWNDPGATCTDEEDGTWRITASKNTIDTTTAGHYIAIYECIDSDGMRQVNGGVRSVYVTAGDLPPVLTLSSYEQTISVNGTWSLPSATCKDKDDGDISSRVTTDGVNSVNVHKAGTYTVSFDCVDAAGNPSTTRFFDVIVKDP